MRVRYSRLFRELDTVDDIPAVAWQFHPVHLFEIGRSRLGELACDTAHFDDRFARRVHEDHIHLKHQLEKIFNGLRIEVRKTLGTVATLQKKGFSASCRSKLALEVPGFACKDQRRVGAQFFFYFFKCIFVLIGWLLLNGEISPTAWCPTHDTFLQNKLRRL